MTRKLFALCAMLACCLFIAACGDDDDDGGDSGSSDTPAQTESSGSGGSGANSAAADSAREGCEAGIKNNPTIDASKQSELSKECEKVAEAAATGDREKTREAYREFCGKLAEALPEQARAPAKSACERGADSIQ